MINYVIDYVINLMTRPKTASQPIRKLTKVGGLSYSVVLPKDYIRELGWREHQKLQVLKKGKQIIIRDWEP